MTEYAEFLCPSNHPVARSSRPRLGSLYRVNQTTGQPTGEYQTDQTLPSCPPNGPLTLLLVSISQIKIVPSVEPDAKCLPLEGAMHTTVPWCPFNGPEITGPVAAPQTWIVQSDEAEIIDSPSGTYVVVLNSMSCSVGGPNTIFPARTPQMRIVLFFQLEAIRRSSSGYTANQTVFV